MIRYALRCDREHRFDSWFGSSGDYDRLRDAGLVTCAVCGSTSIVKDLMAPALGSAATPPAPDRAASNRNAPDRGAPDLGAPDLRAPASPAERALTELRRRIEATAEDVGRNFVSEARSIHAGTAPDRPIIGEARPSEARAMIEEGIPVAPLPWGKRTSN